MIRTAISLDRENKDWLDRRAEHENLSMAEIIRIAVRQYREQMPLDNASFDELLRQTSGIWKGEDALKHQRELRREWRKRQ